MAFQPDAKQIKNFAFLELATAPDRRQRNRGRFGIAIRRALAQNHRPVFQCIEYR